MTDRELFKMALDALIDAADSQSWEMQQNIDQHGEWYRRSVYLKEAVTKSQKAIESLRAALAQPEQEEDYDAIANKQLASLKAAAKVTFEDAVVRAVHKLYNTPPQPKPETVGYLTNALGHEWVFTTKKINQYSQPLYTAPPQREWIGLTPEEARELCVANVPYVVDMVAALEAKLKEKNAKPKES